MKRVAVVQSNYVPWKGYFDLIGRADVFVLYDDVQYTTDDWRNRNLIKTQSGTEWITIPVRTSGRFGQSLYEVEVADPRWARKHWKALQTNYARAAHFDELSHRVKTLLDSAAEMERLSDINAFFIRAFCDWIGISTEILDVSEFHLGEDRTGRLVELCDAVGASHYLTGPAARGYLDTAAFDDAAIEVEWMSYEGYPTYDQLFAPPFEHHVSLLDLLFNVGPDRAGAFMLWSAPKGPRRAGA